MYTYLWTSKHFPGNVTRTTPSHTSNWSFLEGSAHKYRAIFQRKISSSKSQKPILDIFGGPYPKWDWSAEKRFCSQSIEGLSCFRSRRRWVKANETRRQDGGHPSPCSRCHPETMTTNEVVQGAERKGGNGPLKKILSQACSRSLLALNRWPRLVIKNA